MFKSINGMRKYRRNSSFAASRSVAQRAAGPRSTALPAQRAPQTQARATAPKLAIGPHPDAPQVSWFVGGNAPPPSPQLRPRLELDFPGPAPDHSSSALLQRFAAQIIPGIGRDDQIIVRDIKLSGRTESPYTGTMGAHSTAWIVHTDAVRRQLQGLTLDQAIRRMNQLVLEALQSPVNALFGYKRTGLFLFGDTETQMRAAEVKVSDMRLRMLEGKKWTSDLAKSQWLERYIHAYFDYLNRQPMSTVRSGDTTGDNEGKARQPLIQIEGGQDLKLLPGQDEGTQIRGVFAQMFATDTPEAYLRDNLIKTRGLTLEHIWTVALYRFVQALKHAYPRSWARSGLNDVGPLSLWLRSLHPNVPKNILKLWAAFKPVEHEEDLGRQKFLTGAGGDKTGGNLGVQLRLDKMGLINSAAIDGRTDSPFAGTMGAHSTAWVALTDATRNAILGKNVGEAITAIVALARQAMRSPLLQMTPYILPDQARMMARSHIELQYFIRIAGTKTKSDLLQKGRLQQLIAAYLQFTNSIPLHTVEAADTTGNAEGHHRKILLSFEDETLTAKKTKLGKRHRRRGAKTQYISAQTQAIQSFWNMFDPNSVSSFIAGQFPEALPATRERTSRFKARKSRKTTDTRLVNQIEERNRAKVSDRKRAFGEKPPTKNETQVVDRLARQASRGKEDPAARLLPMALAVQSFLHTMEAAYPKAYQKAWTDLDLIDRATALGRRAKYDGFELLRILDKLPELDKIDTSDSDKVKSDDFATLTAEELEELEEAGLREYERRSAERDGVTAQYYIGRASGSWNACLIHSLLRHALGRYPTKKEVQAIRKLLAPRHEDIREGRPINIYSRTGHAVIDAIERTHGVSLNVQVVTNREAPVVPVTAGITPALLYLMPGHFVPCWRK